jgi:prevent-host-death family protein
MTKTISVSEAKNSLSAILDWAVENDDSVVIASRGEPKAVILPYEGYEEYLALKEQARRREALRQLRELSEKIWASTSELSDDEVDQLAEEISQETFQRMIAEGKVQFQ